MVCLQKVHVHVSKQIFLLKEKRNLGGVGQYHKAKEGETHEGWGTHLSPVLARVWVGPKESPSPKHCVIRGTGGGRGIQKSPENRCQRRRQSHSSLPPSTSGHMVSTDFIAKLSRQCENGRWWQEYWDTSRQGRVYNRTSEHILGFIILFETAGGKKISWGVSQSPWF